MPKEPPILVGHDCLRQMLRIISGFDFTFYKGSDKIAPTERQIWQKHVGGNREGKKRRRREWVFDECGLWCLGLKRGFTRGVSWLSCGVRLSELGVSERRKGVKGFWFWEEKAGFLVKKKKEPWVALMELISCYDKQVKVKDCFSCTS